MTVERAEVAADGRSVELTTAPLVNDRVYMIEVNGVRDTQGAAAVNPIAAYTLNEVPDRGCRGMTDHFVDDIAAGNRLHWETVLTGLWGE